MNHDYFEKLNKLDTLSSKFEIRVDDATRGFKCQSILTSLVVDVMYDYQTDLCDQVDSLRDKENDQDIVLAIKQLEKSIDKYAISNMITNTFIAFIKHRDFFDESEVVPDSGEIYCSLKSADNLPSCVNDDSFEFYREFLGYDIVRKPRHFKFNENQQLVLSNLLAIAKQSK